MSENKRSFICYKNVRTSFFYFVTVLAFDRRTDRRTERPSQYFTSLNLRAEAKLLVVALAIDSCRLANCIHFSAAASSAASQHVGYTTTGNR